MKEKDKGDRVRDKDRERDAERQREKDRAAAKAVKEQLAEKAAGGLKYAPNLMHRLALSPYPLSSALWQGSWPHGQSS